MMSHPIVHFEIIGNDPGRLRRYYGALFGWEFDAGRPVSEAVSESRDYGFLNRIPAADGAGGVPGGVGGGPSYDPHVVFYVGVPDVERALERAERLGGRRTLGPARSPQGDLVIAQFEDPEGNVIGLAGGV
jgi:hypothetical protein